MQLSLTTLAEIAASHRLDYEVVVVEWNPPADAGRIRDVIEVPASASGRVRFFEVGERLHHGVQPEETMPFCEYIAKNAGIRRARGDWILASTPDVIFNEDLVRYLARARLLENAFYRIDRVDTVAKLSLDMPWRKRLSACDASTVCVQSSRGPAPVNGLKPPQPYLVRRFLSLVQGRPVWGRPHIDNSEVHTNASGDFLLMARDDWFRLHGYTELCTHAHIDSIMCWTARSAGLDQVLLGGSMRLYHQEHDRAMHSVLPQTDLAPWRRRYEDSMREGMPLILNDEAWGLADHVLPETIL
jgi:hypothetical protein